MNVWGDDSLRWWMSGWWMSDNHLNTVTISNKQPNTTNNQTQQSNKQCSQSSQKSLQQMQQLHCSGWAMNTIFITLEMTSYQQHYHFESFLCRNYVSSSKITIQKLVLKFYLGYSKQYSSIVYLNITDVRHNCLLFCISCFDSFWWLIYVGRNASYKKRVKSDMFL